MTILIIEGVDLSGKTYLIEKLRKHLNVSLLIKNLYKPREAGDKEIYSHYWNILDCMQEIPSDQLILLDRFHPSQAIYSILRAEDEITAESILDIDNTLANNYTHHAVGIIYLTTNLKTLEFRYHFRGDDYIKKEQLDLLRERYKEFMNTVTKIPVLKIDTLNYTPEEYLQEVSDFVRRL